MPFPELHPRPSFFLMSDTLLMCTVLSLTFGQETSADETAAAVLIEPVQGEGGYVVPPAGFMEGDSYDRR